MPQTLSKAIKRPLSDSLKNSLKGRTAFSHVFLKPQKYVTHFHCKRFPDTWFWFVHSIFHSVAQMKTEKMFWAKWRQLKKWYDLERGEVSLMSVSHNPLTLLKGFCGSVDNSKCLGICPASFGAWENCRKSSCNLGTGALNLRQGLIMQPWLASNLQWSACLCLQGAGMKRCLPPNPVTLAFF